MPSTLNAFVEKCFGTVKNPDDKTKMSERLHRLITNAITNDNLNTLDWSAVPVPDITQPPVAVVPPPATNAVATSPSPLRSPFGGGGGVTDASPSSSANPYMSGGGGGGGGRRRKRPRMQLSEQDEREMAQRSSRKQRFHTKERRRFQPPSLTPTAEQSSVEFDPEKLKVVGTCEDLEKNYFRLTSAPDPDTVRPQRVLETHLRNLTRKWEEKDAVECDYLWICDQLKSVRQDLFIQHIQNEFTVSAYEIHARIALEEGDLNEYNQCQTQLRELYATGLQGSALEFTGYRLLYFVYLSGNSKYSEGSTEMAHLMRELDAASKHSAGVAHALAVREAVATGNYCRFFQLFRDDPPFMNQCIMEAMIPTVRLAGLKSLLRAYRPTLDVAFVGEALGFEGRADCVEYLRSGNLVLLDDDAVLDTKKSTLDAAAVEQFTSTGSLL